MTKSKAALTIVPPEVEAAVEQALSDAKELTVSAVSRAGLVANEIQVRRTGFEAERRDMENKRAFIAGALDTALKAIDAELADIDAALALLPGEPT